MSRVSIDCPHCGQTTRLDLSHTLSTQKCDRCGIAFRAVDTGLAGSREIQLTEPPDWRRAKTGEWDADPNDDATATPAAATAVSRTAWIAVGVTLVLVAATAIALARRPPSAPTVQPMTDLNQSNTSATSLADPNRPTAYLNLRDRIEAATAAATKYLSSATLDDLLPLIENRDSLEPQVRAFYTQGEGRELLPFPTFTLAPTDQQVWIDALQSVVISYETPGQVLRAVSLRQDATGQWLVHWPSAAAISDVPLAQFRSQRDTTPRLFRLLAVRDDYFNRAFSSDGDWVCLRLADVTLAHRIYAYARRGTPVADAVLKAPLSRRGPSSPIMLRLRFPDPAPADDQVEITEFLGLGWIETESVADPASPPASPAEESTRPKSRSIP